MTTRKFFLRVSAFLLGIAILFGYLVCDALCDAQEWSPAQEAPVYDLRQHPTSQLGLVRAGADLDASWNLDVWINPNFQMAGERPKRKPSFTLPPGGSKEWKLAYTKGLISVYAEAWIWAPCANGQQIKLLIACTEKSVQQEVNFLKDGQGYGWDITIRLADFGFSRYRWPSVYYRPYCRPE